MQLFLPMSLMSTCVLKTIHPTAYSIKGQPELSTMVSLHWPGSILPHTVSKDSQNDPLWFLHTGLGSSYGTQYQRTIRMICYGFLYTGLGSSYGTQYQRTNRMICYGFLYTGLGSSYGTQYQRTARMICYGFLYTGLGSPYGTQYQRTARMICYGFSTLAWVHPTAHSIKGQPE